MKLGHSLGSETLTREFKEFRFEMIYDFSPRYEKVYKSPESLNKWINNTIKIHLKKYFTKYVQAFNNSNLHGNLYFGVTDDGEVIGYPIHDSDFDSIKSIFNLHENDNVKVSFQKVDLDNYAQFFYPRSVDFLEEMEKMKALYEEYEKDFKLRKDKFISELDAVRLSINDLIKSENKLGFIDYLRDNDAEYLFPKDISCVYPDSDIKLKKKKPDHILYWATKYRDKILDDVIERKPKWDYSQKKVDPYFKILLEFKPMVDYLVSLGYNFYVIQINVKPRNCIIYHQKGKFFKRAISSQGGPCCITSCILEK